MGLYMRIERGHLNHIRAVTATNIEERVNTIKIFATKQNLAQLPLAFLNHFQFFRIPLRIHCDTGHREARNSSGESAKRQILFLKRLVTVLCHSGVKFNRLIFIQSVIDTRLDIALFLAAIIL